LNAGVNGTRILTPEEDAGVSSAKRDKDEE